MTLDKRKITMELTRKLVELDQVAAEDDEILSKFERQHDILSLLVDKAKNRLMSYKPIRSALQSRHKNAMEDVNIRDIIQEKARNVENVGVKMKFERFMEHESIKYQGDLFNPVSKLDSILNTKSTQQEDKENDINQSNLDEDLADTYEEMGELEDDKSDTDSDRRVEDDMNNHKRLEDRTIRERVELMRKRKYCVF